MSVSAGVARKLLEHAIDGAIKNPQGEIVLNEPSAAWFIERGSVDVFIVELVDGSVASTYKHVCRFHAGDLIFGVQRIPGSALELRVKCTFGSVLHKMPADTVLKLCSEPEVADQVDTWIEGLSEAVAREVDIRPRVDAVFEGSTESSVAANDVVSSKRGIVWLTTHAVAAYLSLDDSGSHVPNLLPVCHSTWAQYSKSTSIRTFSTQTLAAEERLFDALSEFHTTALSAERLNRQLALVDIANLQVDTTRLRKSDADVARQQLRRVSGFRPAAAADGVSNLVRALRPIGKRERIEFNTSSTGNEHSLEDILVASGVRARPVTLSTQSNWWLGDSSSLLAFRRDSDEPVALIPAVFGRYRMYEPSTGRTRRMRRQDATALQDRAWTFYRPFPDRQLKTTDVLDIVWQQLPSEVLRFVVAGLVVGLLSFLPLLIIGLLTDWVIPSENRPLLWTITAGLLFTTLLTVLFKFVQGNTLLRVEGRASSRLTAAVWDRLIGIRPTRLHGYTAGELTSRAAAFQSLRERVSHVVSDSLITAVFLFPTLFLLFLFDTTLAMVSLLIGITVLVMIFVLGVIQLEPQRLAVSARNALAGSLYQFISGIHKIRTAGAEQSVFAFWVRGYVAQKDAEIRLNRVNEVAIAIAAAIPFVAAALLFLAATLIQYETFSIGDFFVVYATSMAFLLAATRLGSSVQALASIIPEYRQVQPFLELTPESVSERHYLPHREFELNGDLRLDHVSFAYEESEESVLDDVSIHVHPGEFVAIVGESGAGKSTLLNLALGLEEPTSGAIYYDNQNLAFLNRRALRRQLGVVTQNGSLQPGTVFQNITGVTSGLTERDAWDAAELACIAADLRQMHMGLHTPVSDSSTLFSGGQVQRILIAAALVRRPRVVFFDEATNWLDNYTQSEVMRSIGDMAITRLVIAHRLSTIREADRIYVLQNGKIVQSGTFTELSQVPGLFHDLIQRQQV